MTEEFGTLIRIRFYSLDPRSGSCSGKIIIHTYKVCPQRSHPDLAIIRPDPKPCETYEIDVMEALVEMILTLVYSLNRAPVKVHRWIQALVHITKGCSIYEAPVKPSHFFLWCRRFHRWGK